MVTSEEPTRSVQDQDKPYYEQEEITLRLADSVVQDSVLVLKHGPNFLDEMAGLCRAKRSFDVIIVDCTECGFFLPSAEMIEASTLARSMLQVQGALVFVKHDKAAAMIKESPVGYLSFHVFETFSAVYDYSTSIAKHIQQAMGQGIELNRDSTDLSEQILLTAIPVLTTFGIKLKAGGDGSRKRNTVLSAIDNYTPLSSIAQRLSQQLSFNQLLDELRGLEKSGAVFPIFPKVPFLVHHFRNSRPFKLKDYLLEAKLITREQLDELIFVIQNQKGAQRLSLGALCVSKGLITARQLEVALQDQAFFGQLRDVDKKGKVRLETESDTKIQQLIGNLATTEPAGVLQNLVSNRCNGVLSVEYRERQFRALFEQGKLAFAKQSKLKGNEAVIEFVSVWKEGVYVFIERQPPPDLANDECVVNRPLDKLLLDSALASDNIEAVWKKFPAGTKSTLEKLADPENLLNSTQLADPAEGYALTAEEMEHMRRAWQTCDGLSSIEEMGKKLADLTSVKLALAIGRLHYYKLVQAPETDLSGPLTKFRNIVSQVSQIIGIDRSEALLRIALRAQGYSAVARIFNIGSQCEIGADIAAAKTASLSLSVVVKALEDWQVKYIEHVSQEMDKNQLRDIVYRVYQGK